MTVVYTVAQIAGQLNLHLMKIIYAKENLIGEIRKNIEGEPPMCSENVYEFKAKNEDSVDQMNSFTVSKKFIDKCIDDTLHLHKDNIKECKCECYDDINSKYGEFILRRRDYNEYAICDGLTGRDEEIVLKFCPHCGGKMPEKVRQNNRSDSN